MSVALLPPRVVVYEGNGADPLPPTDRGRLVASLLDRGYAVTLAGASAATASPDGAFVVIGRFGGGPPDVAGVTVVVCDITGASVDEAVQAVEVARGDRRMNRPDVAVDGGQHAGLEAWKPWFPVVDPARCTNCMQCLSFCLFDVYGVSENHQLRVENPANCKVNCPACSRVCPDVAIMFPKYHAGPIDGGPVSEADVTREKMKVDISALLGGDIYAKLRERSAEAQKRFSRERSADQALAERRRCLTKLAEAASIPREVLDALPSPEEIQRRAEEASARAAAAKAAAEAAT
ncbi:MAG: ferredoxin family protein [Planctomycetota bacterium]|jgi:NAD-dependent dihydropyrimidine dehydrogenase PreA subunit|nr:ferredoxin family protein [Planctomycetota bacterium]